MKYIFIDVETTGTDHKIHATHQISGCIITGGFVREVFDFKIKPFDGSIIDNEALDVCGIKISDLYDTEHIDEKLVYYQLITLLDKYVNKFDKKDKFFFVGYNNHFDKNFLYEFFLRNDDKYMFSYFWGNHIDVQVLATQRLLHDRVRLDNFKQGTVAKYLGFKVNEDDLHNSLYDIYICLGMYCYLTNTKFDGNGVDFVSNLDAQLNSLTKQKEFTDREMNETFFKGKHNNKTVRWVLENDPSYIVWYYENLVNQIKVSERVYLRAEEIVNKNINNYKNDGRKYLHEIPENILEHERKLHQKLMDNEKEAWDN